MSFSQIKIIYFLFDNIDTVNKELKLYKDNNMGVTIRVKKLGQLELNKMSA